MTNNAPQTMEPPQAPSKPMVAQQALNELVDYYRQLVNYHHSSVNYYQQLVEHHSSEVELVEKQMANIEALLTPLKQASQSENGAVNPKLVDEPREETKSTDTTDSTLASSAALEPTNPPDGDRELIETQANGKITTETETLSDRESEARLSDNRESTVKSKQNPRNTIESKKTEAKAKIESKASGSSKNRGGKKTRSTTKKTPKPFSSRLPYSPLLEPYETISDAVAGCLQEHYPQVMSGDDILQYYYPEGLSGETKTRAYGAFSNTLSKGAGKKGWIKESIGKYRWREGI